MTLDFDCGDIIADRHEPSGSGEGTVFFLGDPDESLDHEWDTSLRLMAAHRRRGETAHWCTCDDILIRGRTLLLGGMPVGPRDLVWLRLDPSDKIRWYETLRALCHVDARIVNPPRSVLTVHDKRAALAFSPRCAWGAFSLAEFRRAIAELKAGGATMAVLKPPSLFGSKGIHFIAIDDTAQLEAVYAELQPLFGYVIVEPYLGPGDRRTPPDIRVLLTHRRVVGVIERLIPLGGGLSDVKRGAPLTPAQTRLTQQAMAFMNREGVVLAGLDFIGDLMTEINVSCPGAVPEVNLFCDVIAEDLIVADLRATVPG
ncbi:MAG: hypothetical protein HY985_01750 [Magnetospirillum sp.]|nr:hypothetical protein [Magnetospirillum sp.]